MGMHHIVWIKRVRPIQEYRQHKWAASWQIQQNDLCAQLRLRSAWASWIFAVRMKKPWVLRMLSRCPGWSESSLGAQIILLVLLWRGSYLHGLEHVQHCDTHSCSLNYGFFSGICSTSILSVTYDHSHKLNSNGFIKRPNLRDQRLAFYRVDGLLRVWPDLTVCTVLLMKALGEGREECELWHRRTLTACHLYLVCRGDQWWDPTENRIQWNR